MTIWVVMDGDYDGDWIVAAYDSEVLAHDHVQRTGDGRVEEVAVSSVLVESVAAIDPIEAVESRERQQAAAREKYEVEQARLKEQDTRTEAMTIGAKARLCHCRTFSTDSYFVTANGYCRYCGGWTPDVFRARFGDDGLARAIDLLAYHDRAKMLELTGMGSPDDAR